MKHFRRFTLCALLPMLLIVLCFLVNCTGEPWLDNGVNYLCPECKNGPAVHVYGPCGRCDTATITISFKYCYDCAKELNCCQRCGIER